MKSYFFLCVFLLVFSGCHSKKQLPSNQPIEVTAFLVEAETIPAEFQFVGVTKSSHPVQIRSRVEGYLMSIEYVEGSMVEKDKLLFRIDPRQFLADVEKAEGELARQEAVLWRAKKTLSRIKPLYEKNASSLRDLDNAIAEVLTAEASVITAKGNLEVAKLNLSYTKISSPIKGMVSKSIYYEGTLITPSVNGLLTEVSVIDPIWVYFSVSESEMLMGKGLKKQEELILPEESDYSVQLVLVDGSIFPHEGKVNFSAPTLDPQTGALMVRAVFPNPEGDLLPGEFVRANVMGAKRPNAIFVPQQSVFQGRKGMYVFVVEPDNKVVSRLVEVGPWYQDYWVIQKGLEDGDVVVADGISKLQDGVEVKITKLIKAEDTLKKKDGS